MVVLGVSTEDSLRALHATLVAAGVPCVLVVEDAGPLEGQATAIGVVPAADGSALKNAIRKETGALRLVK